jgi:epsin
MNRERIRLVAFPITVNGISISNNNLIDLQGQNNGLQPQFTVQPQVTSFNPYQQQAQQEAMQVSTLTFSGMTNRLDRHLQAEWARQQQEWMVQQQQQQQQQLQLQAQQEEWMRHQLAQQQTAQQQALLAQQQQEFLAAQAQQQTRIAPQPTAFGFVHFELFSFGRTDNCVK